MTFVVHMLAHTPPYVFVLLAYLIWQGVLHPSCADVNADRVFMFHYEMMTPGLVVGTWEWGDWGDAQRRGAVARHGARPMSRSRRGSTRA
jgi:hypothetical protein